MSKLIKLDEKAQQDAVIEFIKGLYNDYEHDAETISQYILNALYQFTMVTVTVKPEEVNNCPCPPHKWISLAIRIKSKLEHYLQLRSH